MRRVLAAAALVAFGAIGHAAPAQALCATDALCTVSGCYGTVNVCAGSNCSGTVSVCPFAKPDHCASSVDVCPGITFVVCVPCIVDASGDVPQ